MFESKNSNYFKLQKIFIEERADRYMKDVFEKVINKPLLYTIDTMNNEITE